MLDLISPDTRGISRIYLKIKWLMFQFSHNLWRGQKKHTDTPPCFVSLYRYSEENRPCGVLHSCCLSSLDTSHHGANDEKKEKVRVIFIFLWRTWLTCVHIAICLSLSCWCFCMLALETHPCGNTSFKAIRFNLNARFISTMGWAGGFFFQTAETESTQHTWKGERLTAGCKWAIWKPEHAEGPRQCLSK